MALSSNTTNDRGEPVCCHSHSPSHIILVHGTNARNAPWTWKGSLLFDTITAAFPEASIIPFNWSGKNSHSARLIAGHELNDLINNSTQGEPEPRIAIISHSHGGNVVLYAL